jgi:hypothetical protein
MNNTKDDNMTLGTLLLGIGVVILVIWFLKFLLSTLLNVAESILMLGFYIVAGYIVLTILLSIYSRLRPRNTPRPVKLALAFNHSLALSIKYSFKLIRKLFIKRDAN